MLHEETVIHDSWFAVSIFLQADMAELADAPDLGSGGQPPCRFKSCYPHLMYSLTGKLMPVNFVVNPFFSPFHKMFRLGNTTLNMFKSDGIDKTVTDSLIYYKLHIQVSLAA